MSLINLTFIIEELFLFTKLTHFLILDFAIFIYQIAHEKVTDIN